MSDHCHTPVGVLLVDPHPIFRCALRAALGGDPWLAVVGEVGSGVAAIAQAITLRRRLLAPSPAPDRRSVVRARLSAGATSEEIATALGLRPMPPEHRFAVALDELDKQGSPWGDGAAEARPDDAVTWYA